MSYNFGNRDALTDRDGNKIIRHGDNVKIAGISWSRQVFSTLSGYGAQYGDYDGPNGPEAYEAALIRNGKRVWFNASAVVISRYREPETTYVEFAVGDTVRVVSDTPGEGGLYTVVKPSFRTGDSAGIVPVSVAQSV